MTSKDIEEVFSEVSAEYAGIKIFPCIHSDSIKLLFSIADELNMRGISSDAMVYDLTIDDTEYQVLTNICDESDDTICEVLTDLTNEYNVDVWFVIDPYNSDNLCIECQYRDIEDLSSDIARVIMRNSPEM